MDSRYILWKCCGCSPQFNCQNCVVVVAGDFWSEVESSATNTDASQMAPFYIQKAFLKICFRLFHALEWISRVQNCAKTGRMAVTQANCVQLLHRQRRMNQKQRLLQVKHVARGRGILVFGDQVCSGVLYPKLFQQ